MGKLNIKHAFTMAEAILVMTILGIIATIMITTLKPAEYKDKGLAIQAKKVLSEIDTATTMILMNDVFDERGLVYLLTPDARETMIIQRHQDYIITLEKLYKKYMTATRKPCTSEAECGICAVPLCDDTTERAFYLKDGACVRLSNCYWKPDAEIFTIFPGEVNQVLAPNGSNGSLLYITFDTNGIEEPNVFGKDQFRLPMNRLGIMYDE